MTREPDELERRLSAILAADVVGYSAMVERDEESTIKAVKSLWQNIMEPTARREGGRIVKTMGDGVLAEFPSAVRAVKCALNVQEAATAGNTAFPDGVNLVLRIGLHIGDIVIDGDDILGDGVNLAARLESLASPGGVCISSAVWEQLTTDLADKFEDTGEQTVKNISRPIRTFAFLGEHNGQRANTPKDADTDRKPTVSVGVFDALTKDETSQILSQGCQQTTAAYLSTLTGLTLVSENASPDYSAMATFQLLGDRYRCMLKLCELPGDKPILNERLDGVIDDLFDTQDALSNRIATTIRYAVNENEGDKAATAHGSAPTLEQSLSRAGTLMMGPERNAWKEAGALLDRYLDHRPNEFMALSMKACSLLLESICGVEFVPEADGEQARKLLDHARQQNERSDFLHIIRAEFLWGVDFDMDGAMRAVDRSLDVTPDYVLALQARARFNGLIGKYDEALQAYDELVPLVAQNRILHRFLANKSMCLFANGDLESALDVAQKSLDHAPGYVHASAFATAAAQCLGRAEESRRHLSDLLAIKPDLTMSLVRPMGFANEDAEKMFRSGLEAAGVPA